MLTMTLNRLLYTGKKCCFCDWKFCHVSGSMDQESLTSSATSPSMSRQRTFQPVIAHPWLLLQNWGSRKMWCALTDLATAALQVSSTSTQHLHTPLDYMYIYFIYTTQNMTDSHTTHTSVTIVTRAVMK